jgi:hypothetical protein
LIEARERKEKREKSEKSDFGFLKNEAKLLHHPPQRGAGLHPQGGSPVLYTGLISRRGVLFCGIWQMGP